VVKVQSYVYCSSKTLPPKNAIYSSGILFRFSYVRVARRYTPSLDAMELNWCVSELQSASEFLAIILLYMLFCQQ